MRKLLVGILIAFLLITLGEYVSHLALKWEYNHASFSAGVITIIIIYVIIELFYKIKDRSAGNIAKANVTITLKDATPDDVATNLATGMQTFNSFMKLGKQVTEHDNISNESKGKESDVPPSE